MSGKHGHKSFEGHMHDYEAHITAVEEDLEYYRAKRLEPRIIYLIRRGIVTFYDLLRARAALKRANQFFETRKPEGKDLEARLRYLAERHDEYLKAITLVSKSTAEGIYMLKADTREARGDYDHFLTTKKKEHHDTLQERTISIAQDLKDS